MNVIGSSSFIPYAYDPYYDEKYIVNRRDIASEKRHDKMNHILLRSNPLVDRINDGWEHLYKNLNTRKNCFNHSDYCRFYWHIRV